MKKVVLFTSFALGFIGMSLNLKAQEADTAKFQQALEMSFEDLLNVKIVTSSKMLRSSYDVTQKVDVVNKDHINQILADKRNIAEYIQYLPGAAVKVLSRNDANWGAYGGIGPKYNTFMLGGLPLDAFVDPQSIDVLAIDHIEIQRGPASVLYPNYLSQDFAGNQSPLAGTVNLIMRDNITKPKSMFSLGYGSYNTISGQAYHENKFGRLNIFGGLSYEMSDYTDYGSPGSWLNMQKDPEYRKAKAFIGGSFNLDKEKKHTISFIGNQTFHWGDWGREFRKYNFQYSLFNIQYNGEMAENWTLAVKTGIRNYYRQYEGDTYDTIVEKYVLEDESGVEQLIIPSDISLSFNHYNNSNLTAGIDFQSADYKNWNQPVNQDKSIGNQANVRQIGFYVQEEFQWKQLTLRAGTRYNMINYSIDRISGQAPGEDTRSWNVVLWSAGAKYRFSEAFTIFANAGTSFMSPSLKSIGGTIPLLSLFIEHEDGQLPNPDLKPENGLGIDGGFNAKLPASIFVSARGFYTTLTDAIIDIVVSENPSQTMSVNADGETISQGVELSVKQKYKKIEWFGNITYTDSKIKNPDNPDQDGAEVPFVPKMMGNLGFTLFLPYDITFSPWAHFGGKIYDSNSLSGRNEFNSKEVINLVINKRIKLKKSNDLDVYVKLYNLTDNKYDMPWQFRDPGFNFTFGVRIVL